VARPSVSQLLVDHAHHMSQDAFICATARATHEPLAPNRTQHRGSRRTFRRKPCSGNPNRVGGSAHGARRIVHSDHLQRVKSALW
jgi:hypothetical protein